MKPDKKVRITPVSLPVIYFLTVILAGTLLLMAPFSRAHHQGTGFLDALFTATSAVCVTGLATLDTGTHFSRAGQTIIMLLIQLGGLGIMTFTSLAFYLLRRKVSFNDHINVSQTMMLDTSFHLAKFLKRIFLFTIFIEGIGALLLYLLDPAKFTPFSAVFHAVSAFCNAGFSLFSDSLMAFSSNWGVNFVVMRTR